MTSLLSEQQKQAVVVQAAIDWAHARDTAMAGVTPATAQNLADAEARLRLAVRDLERGAPA